MSLYLFQNRSVFRIVDDQMAVFDVRLTLFNEPGHGVPRTASPVPGNALKTALFADILNPEGSKILFRPHVNPIKFPLAG